jgi:phosphoribosyl 1,2-cyclic phosphodiesterase
MKIKVIASGSKGNCYILSGARDVLLIEAGVPKRKVLEGLGHDISKVVGVLVSHEHLDHASAVKELLNLSMDVYASKGTLDTIGAINRNARVLEVNKPISIGEFDVLPFLVQHDASEPLGFLIESRDLKQRVVFATDTNFLKKKF